MNYYDAMNQGLYGTVLNWDGATIEKLAMAIVSSTHTTGEK